MIVSMLKFLIAAIAILALLFGPMIYAEYQLGAKIANIQTQADKTVTPFKVFRPPTASVEALTNYTKVQMAITGDGVVYYYGKSEYAPDLIEPNSLLIIQHVYIPNASGGGFETEKNGQKYFYFSLNGLRTLVFSKNTNYANPTEINLILAGTLGAGVKLDDEPEYSKKMIGIAESMH